MDGGEDPGTVGGGSAGVIADNSFDDLFHFSTVGISDIDNAVQIYAANEGGVERCMGEWIDYQRFILDWTGGDRLVAEFDQLHYLYGYGRFVYIVYDLGVLQCDDFLVWG